MSDQPVLFSRVAASCRLTLNREDKCQRGCVFRHAGSDWRDPGPTKHGRHLPPRRGQIRHRDRVHHTSPAPADLFSINTATLGYKTPLPAIIDACAARGIGAIAPWRRDGIQYSGVVQRPAVIVNRQFALRQRRWNHERSVTTPGFIQYQYRNTGL